MRVVQRQQELTSTGVDVQNPHLRLEVSQDLLPVIPGQITLLHVPPLDVGKVPSVDVGDLLFRFPSLDQLVCVHVIRPFCGHATHHFHGIIVRAQISEINNLPTF